MFWVGQGKDLYIGEYDYYKIWVLLTEFGIKPHEIDLIPIEDLNALWCMYEYRLERSEHETFKAESKKHD